MQELHVDFDITDVHGVPIAVTPRLARFARRWAQRWLRLYGAPPHLHHPFPNWWHTTFVIYYGPAHPGQFARWQQTRAGGTDNQASDPRSPKATGRRPRLTA
jgi:hypothetical protein